MNRHTFGTVPTHFRDSFRGTVTGEGIAGGPTLMGGGRAPVPAEADTAGGNSTVRDLAA